MGLSSDSIAISRNMGPLRFQGFASKDDQGTAFSLENFTISGPKKPWQPQTWQDLTRFSPLDFPLLSPDFGGPVLLNHTENLEKKQKIQWRASSGDGAPKLQISVPCRGRTCPDNPGRKSDCFFQSLGPLREKPNVPSPSRKAKGAFEWFWAPAPKSAPSALWHFGCPKRPRSTPRSTLWDTPRQVPRISQKALFGALCGPP